jgi:hypothetical protein
MVMERTLGIGTSELCEIYVDTKALVCRHYRLLVENVDVERVRPLASDWSDIMEARGCTERVWAMIDGSAHATARLGSKSEAAKEYAAWLSSVHFLAFAVNILQRAYFNGHYK